MTFNGLIPQGPGASPSRRAFTLAEVLAALVFMAIVIPVALHGMRVASMAGESGQRRSTAVRIADRVLNEMIATGQYQSGMQRGVINEGAQSYSYLTRSQPWTEDSLVQVTAEVSYYVQGQNYNVHLSTLVESEFQ